MKKFKMQNRVCVCVFWILNHSSFLLMINSFSQIYMHKYMMHYYWNKFPEPNRWTPGDTICRTCGRVNLFWKSLFNLFHVFMNSLALLYVWHEVTLGLVEFGRDREFASSCYLVTCSMYALHSWCTAKALSVLTPECGGVCYCVPFYPASLLPRPF